MTTPALNTEQQSATESVVAWLAQPYSPATWAFRLIGSAGTGKTFCVRALLPMIKGRIVFTAPTNKAVRVLRMMFEQQEDPGAPKPLCKTIYSLLGLQIQPNGELKELVEPGEPVDLSDIRLLVIDEASMLNSQVLKHLRRVCDTYRLPVLFMGDQYQLPPVKEIQSPIWKMKELPTAELTKVMRYDNQILRMATDLRQEMSKPVPMPKVIDNNDGEEGIFLLPGHRFQEAICRHVEAGHFTTIGHTKAIAWRNARVDELNAFVRRQLFPGEREPWVKGDRVIFTEPAKNLEDTKIASTDDEGEVVGITEAWHPLYSEMRVYMLSVMLDWNASVTAIVLHPSSAMAYEQKLARLREEALEVRSRWRAFWEFKEAFHSVRHAYALTAHRSQGSTFENVFVDWRDIMTNRTRTEAMQCLYVAVTRPKHRLYLN